MIERIEIFCEFFGSVKISFFGNNTHPHLTDTITSQQVPIVTDFNRTDRVRNGLFFIAAVRVIIRVLLFARRELKHNTSGIGDIIYMDTALRVANNELVIIHLRAIGHYTELVKHADPQRIRIQILTG
jgi:hypothetical protein